ncbi:MAG: YceD family protein [Gallionella sp.]
MNARSFIDSLDFASNRREISGEVPVAELQRLHDLLENQQGKLAYSIRGGVDDQGSPYLDMNVNGRFQVRCQRCLEGMDFPVQLETRLMLRDQASLDTEELLAGQPGHEQEFDSILADAHLDVLGMLEDEILLSLPIAPRHEQGACQVAGGGNMHQVQRRPFAELAKLKRN